MCKNAVPCWLFFVQDWAQGMSCIKNLSSKRHEPTSNSEFIFLYILVCKACESIIRSL